MMAGIFFQNWEKIHINFIGSGAEFRSLRTPKNPWFGEIVKRLRI